MRANSLGQHIYPPTAEPSCFSELTTHHIFSVVENCLKSSKRGLVSKTHTHPKKMKSILHGAKKKELSQIQK